MEKAAIMTPSLEDELGVPDSATLTPSSIKAASLETSNGQVIIPISPETSIRRDDSSCCCRALMVGRQAATADIRIQHKSISRKHALIYFDNEKMFLKDLGTKHGTTVNEKRLEQGNVVELKNGDSVLFGNVRESIFQVKIVKNDTTVQSSSSQDDDDDEAHQQQQHDEVSGADRDLDLIEKAGEGLTGRAKRQAEIAAMMNSFDQAPTFQKHSVAPKEIEDSIATTEEQKQSDALVRTAERYKLPISNQFTISSESSERRNVTTCLAIDPAGSRFVVGSTDTHLRFYDFGGMAGNQGESFKTVIPDDGYLLVDCAYSNTGDRILVGTGSVQPKVLDRDGEEIITFMRGDMYVTDQAKTVGHTAAVTSVDWNPLERDYVLTGSNDGSARIWNLNGKTQFHMLVCDKVFQAKNVRGQRTGVTSVCFHPGGREFALGTACGSIQVWNRSRVSGRPERAVFHAHGENKPINSLTYSMDGTKLASRCADDDTVKVWNAQRLSRSSAPFAICKDLQSVHEKANAAFSPDGKILCAGASWHQKEGEMRREYGRLNFYDLSNVSPTEAFAKLILSLDIDKGGPVAIKWHVRLNQIFTGCSDGRTIVFYDSKLSRKGALLPTSKSVRGSDGLSELLRSRAPRGSAALSGEIVTPFSLPMYQKKKPDKKRKREELKSREPERPATGKHKTGGQVGGNVSFAQYVADQTVVKTKPMAGRDPREALVQYEKEGGDGSDRLLAEKTAEEEEEEMMKSKKT